MRSRGIASLMLTVLLCLPSLAGAGVIVVNFLLQRGMGEWGVLSSATVASAVFLGWPLTLLAAIVSCLTGLRRKVPAKVKYTHYFIVCLATVSTFSLSFHFGM
jgi:uncharacterized BrkB/YihY/UPF0761 family membrane protein